ncbi:hypothetical protein Tco_0623673, partial [Tanacetum coccineum]
VSELRYDERVEGAAVVISMEVVKEVSSAFDNTLYGYFIRKRLAFGSNCTMCRFLHIQR